MILVVSSNPPIGPLNQLDIFFRHHRLINSQIDDFLAYNHTIGLSFALMFNLFFKQDKIICLISNQTETTQEAVLLTLALQASIAFGFGLLIFCLVLMFYNLLLRHHRLLFRLLNVFCTILVVVQILLSRTEGSPNHIWSFKAIPRKGQSKLQ